MFFFLGGGGGGIACIQPHCPFSQKLAVQQSLCPPGGWVTPGVGLGVSPASVRARERSRRPAGPRGLRAEEGSEEWGGEERRRWGGGREFRVRHLLRPIPPSVCDFVPPPAGACSQDSPRAPPPPAAWSNFFLQRGRRDAERRRRRGDRCLGGVPALPSHLPPPPCKRTHRSAAWRAPLPDALHGDPLRGGGSGWKAWRGGDSGLGRWGRSVEKRGGDFCRGQFQKKKTKPTKLFCGVVLPTSSRSPRSLREARPASSFPAGAPPSPPSSPSVLRARSSVGWWWCTTAGLACCSTVSSSCWRERSKAGTLPLPAASSRGK